MPIPFDMLAVMLFIGYYTETVAPHPPSAAMSLAIVLAATVVMSLASAVINCIALKRLGKPGLSLPARRGIAGRAEGLVRVVLIVIYMVMLEESALPWSIAKAWGLSTHAESFAIQLLGLFPYVLLFFAAWLPMYRLHQRTRPGFWTRRSYILHMARYNLYVLLAWIPFAFLADWLGDFIIVLPFLFLAAAWAFPVLLARAWGCKPLPEGDALEAVRRMEAKAGVRFSKVYLWEPGGGNAQNAAAVGFLPPFRFLFLTPALIRGMNKEELEAVILHELGHIKKKHLLFYLITSLAGINAAVLAGLYLPVTSAERFIITAALVLLYFRFIFGWMSRNMERQADLFALEKTGSASGLVNALEKLGISAGNVRLATSWHHLGIAERVDYLRRAEKVPEIIRGHNAAVSQLMFSGYLLSILFIIGMAGLIYEEYTRPAPAGPTREAVAKEQLAHWRRLDRLLPDDPIVSLELAHSLAGKPGSRLEAAGLAEKAHRLANSNEVRDAAAKLLHELRE